MNENKALEILGLTAREAWTESELLLAYRRTRQRTHPDKRHGTAAAFIESKAAYDFLKGRVNAPSFSNARQQQRNYRHSGWVFNVDKFVSDFWNEKVRNGKAKYSENEVFGDFVVLLLSAHRSLNGTLLTKKKLMEICESALFSTNNALGK